MKYKDWPEDDVLDLMEKYFKKESELLKRISKICTSLMQTKDNSKKDKKLLRELDITLEAYRLLVEDNQSIELLE